jgi:hypothetical protein
MASLIHFTRGRLLVGHRARDWKEVYFDPRQANDAKNAATEDTKGNKPEKVYFYLSKKSKEAWEAPQKGEIFWYPWYEVNTFEANTHSRKSELQWEFLTHAYNYLSERDLDTLRIMEQELDNPEWTRWNKWFEQAKRFKAKQMPERRQRRNARVQTGIAGGLSPKDADDQVNSESSDSAYESDDTDRITRRAQRGSRNMPPPPRPGPGGSKRRTGGNGPKNGSKRTKSSGYSGYAGRQETPFMSGGRGGSRSGFGGGFGSSVRDDDDEDGDSEMFDGRPPQGSPSLVNGAETTNPTPPATGNRRNANRTSMRRQEVEDEDLFVGSDFGRNMQDETGFGLAMPGGDESWQQLNNGLSNDEAMIQAMRASAAPEETRNGEDTSGQQPVEQAVQDEPQSGNEVPQEEGRPGGVVRSIEPDGGDEALGEH